VAHAIRRLARLRPAVLIIEDIHLLSGAPLRELIDLFESIEDESIAVMVTTRTQEHTARKVIERWPIERLSIAPFTSSDLADAWRTLLNDNPSESIISTLADATAGNPLALRSALRGVLRAKAVVQGVDGMWIAQPSFAAVAARSASSLVEGMLVAVRDDDRNAASRLATLGEIFSREAALVIVESSTIDRLLVEGVLHELAQSAPALPGFAQSASLALAFSHSLVHRHFIEARPATVSELICVIADGLPLYSMHPFVVVVETLRQSNVAIEGISAKDVRAAINASSSLALALDKTVDWELAIVAQKAAERLLEVEAQSLDDTERGAREVGLTAVTLALMRRQMTSPEYGVVLDRFVAMTGDQLAASLSWYRLARAIAAARRRYLIEGYEAGRSVYDDVRRIVADEPSLRLHRQYALVLQTFAQFADEHGDTSMRREIEREYRDIIENTTIDEDHRVLLQTQVLPYLLTLFESEDELRARERMYVELQELEKHPSPMARLLVHAMLPSAPAFLARTGRVDELLAFIADRRDIVKAQGMLVVHYYFDLYQLWCDTLLGLESDRVLSRLNDLAHRH
ncbi:MAG: hypothetical protein H7X80_09970, partial [bacterium]|nr:hypothetical protein [Candidatus Kapabacteria bacterium]